MILVLTDLGPDAVGRGDQPPRVDEGGAAVGRGADQPCDIAWGHVMCHVSCEKQSSHHGHIHQDHLLQAPTMALKIKMFKHD